MERFVCDLWGVKEDCILISVEGVRGKFKEKIKKRRGWFMGNVNWEMFKSELGREAYIISVESFARFPGRVQLESLHGWICIAVNKATKRFVRGKRAAWWTEQLKDLKGRAAKARKKWQLTPKRERNLDGNERWRFEYQGLLKHYKKANKETKVLWWRILSGLLAMQICGMPFISSEGLVDVWDGDRTTETWRDTVEVLLRDFSQLRFP